MPSSSAVRWDKYTWVDFGDSYLPSELNAAYLWAQLLHADEINDNRMATWNAYHDAFRPLADAGRVELPTIPADCVHNAHMFYLKLQGSGGAHRADPPSEGKRYSGRVPLYPAALRPGGQEVWPL